MASPARPGEVARAPLSRERVLRAAVDLADRDGLAALTMRRLAQDLGVEAMSLYYYVPNKNAILSGIVDLVTDEIALPSAVGDWQTSVRRMALSAYDVFTRHPWAAGLTLSNAGLSAARMRYMDSILGTLRGAGFSADMTDHAYHAIESHIMGFTLWEVGMSLGTADELRTLATDVLAVIPAAEYPHLVEHIHQHLKPRGPDAQGEFAFGLDLLLEGLERRRVATGARDG